ncbi:hypothetical protein EDD18DRAFT_1332351 [Armillaria luteobubalina]|uniref:Uncharacterized protein n=1 Tax=Armillaria luteobubalina TaxID=153913 RepID=A0AA39Q3D8_9AGAR|nr:hypothetical protein EDD18DRAFT_1332351 [Armillaria luteobubalina]
MSSPVPSVPTVQKRKRSARVHAVPAAQPPVDVLTEPLPLKACDVATVSYLLVFGCSAALAGASKVDPPVPVTDVSVAAPAVTVTHPRGIAVPTVRRRYSYGELSSDEVTAVVESSVPIFTQASPVGPVPSQSRCEEMYVSSEDGSGDEALSAYHSDVRPIDRNDFVDNMAEEVSGESGYSDRSDAEDTGAVKSAMVSSPLDSPSSYTPVASQASCDGGMRVSEYDCCVPLSVPTATDVWSVSRTRTKTAKGLLADGLAVDVALDDASRDDSSLAVISDSHSGVRKRRSGPSRGAALTGVTVLPVSSAPRDVVPSAIERDPPASQVYLEDLYSESAPPGATSGVGSTRRTTRSRTNKTRRAVPDTSSGALSVHTDVHSAVSGNGTPSAPSKSLVLERPLADAFSLEPVACVPSAPTSAFHSSSSAIHPAPQTPTKSRAHSTFLESLDALIGQCRDDSPEPVADDTPVAAASTGIAGASRAPQPPVQNLDEPVDDSLRVMLPELQEEQLRDLYAAMPRLGAYRAMIPPGEAVETFDHPPCMTFDAIISLFSRGALRSVLSWYKWGGTAPYCNLSTLPRPALGSDGRKATYNSQTAVAITVGVVTNCSLYNAAQQGGYKSEAHVSGGKTYHSIRVMPLSQLWRRECTMLGLLFFLTLIKSSAISPEGIEFSTRPLAVGTSAYSNHNKCWYSFSLECHALTVRVPVPSPLLAKKPASTTGKSSPSVRWPKSPSKSVGLGSSPQREFYHCLGFDDEVPIYDGRSSQGRHFLFHQEDFDNLATMPRYHPARDLDRFTLVAVGYTPSVWTVSSVLREARLSMNVQFVIVLGQAPPHAELASAGYVDA